MEQQLNAVQSESKEEKSKKIVIVSRETSSRFVLMDFCFQDYTKSIALIIEHSIWERATNQVSFAYMTRKSMKMLPQLAVQTAIKWNKRTKEQQMQIVN